MEFRVSWGTRAKEAVLLLVVSWMGVAVAMTLNPRESVNVVLWGAFTLAGLAALHFLRWGRVLRIDPSGISRSRRFTLAWSEIESIFERDDGVMIFRAPRGRIRITPHFRDAATARERARGFALPAVRERLKDAWGEHGFVTFRTSRWAGWGHLLYLVLACVVSVSLGGIVMAFLEEFNIGVLVGFGLLLLLLGTPVRRMRQSVGWQGGWVAAGSEALLVHRLDGETRIRWEDLEGVGFGTPGWLELHRASGKPVRIPTDLGNIDLLHEIISARLSPEEGTPWTPFVATVYREEEP